MPGRQFRLANAGYSGYSPVLAAGRQRLFAWDGSLRSALFPRKESLTACLNQQLFEIRFLRALAKGTGTFALATSTGSKNVPNRGQRSGGTGTGKAGYLITLVEKGASPLSKNIEQ
jgi:hypothetical protein